jgi:hypothetical protein
MNTPLTTEQRERFAGQLERIAQQVRDPRFEVKVADIMIAVELTDTESIPVATLTDAFVPTREILGATAVITVEISPRREIH